MTGQDAKLEIRVPLSANLSAQPAAPFKDRRGWLVAFGVIQILIACFCLLFVAFTLVEFVTSMLPPYRAEGPYPGPADLLAILACGPFGVLFLILGVGSVKRKNWARIATQIVSGFWLLIGLPISLFFTFAVSRYGGAGWLQPQEVRFLIIGLYLTMVLLPLTLLVFYSLKSVRATCRAVGNSAIAATAGHPGSM
jgi:hypothetical protein